MVQCGHYSFIIPGLSFQTPRGENCLALRFSELGSRGEPCSDPDMVLWAQTARPHGLQLQVLEIAAGPTFLPVQSTIITGTA
jgi:hypothetical protein